MVRFSQLHKTIPYHLHKNIILLHLRFLNIFFKNKPVPLSYWIKFSSFINYLFPSLNHISPHPSVIESTGDSLGVPELRDILKDEILDRWALDKVSIEFLWDKMLSEFPKNIVECGSGVSTLMLAKYAEEFSNRYSYPPIIISLEQNSDVKKSIEDRLDNIGLKDAVKIIHNPTNDLGYYIGDKGDIIQTLGDEKIDLILIDGPSGPPGCRVDTIYYLSEFCRKETMWFLDDSFRKEELRVLRQWKNTVGIKVDGIYPFGKGLGAGEIKDPTKI